MDYKSAEHSNTFKCPECESIEYVCKEKDEDSYGNNIFVIECKCGHKYWFHQGGRKIGVDLMELKNKCDKARNVIGRFKTPIKERHDIVKEALKSYWYCGCKKDEKSLALALVYDLQRRLVYDPKLLQELYNRAGG